MRYIKEYMLYQTKEFRITTKSSPFINVKIVFSLNKNEKTIKSWCYYHNNYEVEYLFKDIYFKNIIKITKRNKFVLRGEERIKKTYKKGKPSYIADKIEYVLEFPEPVIFKEKKEFKYLAISGLNDNKQLDELYNAGYNIKTDIIDSEIL